MIGAYRQPTGGSANLGMQSPLTTPIDPMFGRTSQFQGSVDLNVSRVGPAAAAGGDDLLQQILKANPGADPAKIKEALKGAGAKATGFLKGAVTPMNPAQAVKFGAGRLGVAGGLLAGGLTAVDALQQGRPLEAAVGGGGAALGTIGGTVLGGMVGGPVGAFVGGSLGSMLGGQLGTAAEYIKRDVTGDPIRGKDDLKNEIARQKKLDELESSRYRSNLGVYTSAVQDLQQFSNNQEYLQAQRMLPLVNKMKNQELVRQQALLASQTQSAAMLGTLATAGALAQGQQRETGAMIRTAMTSNPYAGAVLQAPQIKFG